MELQPYICKCCNGRINVAKMECEYCGTPYQDASLKHVKFSVVRPGVNRLAASVRINREDIMYNPEGARDYALRELRQQLADGLLAFMKFTTEVDYREHVECIRGEVRVVDPTFDTY